jgi:hypothetical protein
VNSFDAPYFRRFAMSLFRQLAADPPLPIETAYATFVKRIDETCFALVQKAAHEVLANGEAARANLLQAGLKLPSLADWGQQRFVDRPAPTEPSHLSPCVPLPVEPEPPAVPDMRQVPGANKTFKCRSCDSREDIWYAVDPAPDTPEGATPAYYEYRYYCRACDHRWTVNA